MSNPTKDIFFCQSTFSSLGSCSCISHTNNGTMGPYRALDDAAVYKSVRMGGDEDIVIRGEIKDENK
jgi:hypothetical protein